MLDRLGPLFGLERFVTQLLGLPSGGVAMIAAAMCKRLVNALRFPPPLVTRKQHVLLAGEARWCPSRGARRARADGGRPNMYLVGHGHGRSEGAGQRPPALTRSIEDLEHS